MNDEPAVTIGALAALLSVIAQIIVRRLGFLDGTERTLLEGALIGIVPLVAGWLIRRRVKPKQVAAAETKAAVAEVKETAEKREQEIHEFLAAVETETAKPAASKASAASKPARPRRRT